MQKKLLLIILFALITAFFAIQNASPVLVRIFKWEVEVSLVFIVLGAIAFGALIMALVSSFKQLKLGKEIRVLKKEKEKLMNEIEEMEKTIGVLRTKMNRDKSGPGTREDIANNDLESNKQDTKEEKAENKETS